MNNRVLKETRDIALWEAECKYNRLLQEWNTRIRIARAEYDDTVEKVNKEYFAAIKQIDNVTQV